jgi:hypothetical protein
VAVTNRYAVVSAAVEDVGVPADLPLNVAALDRILIALPVHVLYFDDRLFCRYAAPAGPHFLGWTADDLLGTAAARIFPGEMALEPQFARVLTTQSSWLGKHLAYPAGPGGAWDAGAWDVHLEPWTLSDEPAHSAGTHLPIDESAVGRAAGVLMSCLPCERQEAGLSSNAAGSIVGDERVARLLDGIRNQLTVIGGFAGLLRRRPGGDADPAVERIGRAVVALGVLLEQYETATRER